MNGWIIISSFVSEEWGVLAEDDPSVLSAYWDWMLWPFFPNGVLRLGSVVCQTILKQG